MPQLEGVTYNQIGKIGISDMIILRPFGMKDLAYTIMWSNKRVVTYLLRSNNGISITDELIDHNVNFAGERLSSHWGWNCINSFNNELRRQFPNYRGWHYATRSENGSTLANPTELERLRDIMTQFKIIKGVYDRNTR